MAEKTIPTEVRREVETLVEAFNRKELAKWHRAYHVRFRGRYAYLDRDDGPGPSPICRLEYMGTMTNWEFSIYKYSSDRYDPEDHWYPGFELLDGTVQGAMRAGMRAYD
jgi:hypothetical protein